MKLIIGLGNPGAEYVGTRHNVGFEVVDILSKRHRISVSKREHKSVLGSGIIGREKVCLARPMTFMNLSGDAVATPIAAGMAKPIPAKEPGTRYRWPSLRRNACARM